MKRPRPEQTDIKNETYKKKSETGRNKEFRRVYAYSVLDYQTV